MNSLVQPSKSTKEQTQDASGELTVHRFSRWLDKDGRLFVVFGFWYGLDIAKPHAGHFQKTDIELLDVQKETIEILPYGRFLHYVIHNKLRSYHGPITTSPNFNL